MEKASEETKDMQCRVVIDSAWVEECCTVGQLVDHTPFLVPLYQPTVDRPNMAPNFGSLATDPEGATEIVGEEIAGEEVKRYWYDGDDDDDLNELVSNPPSPKIRSKVSPSC